MVCYFASWSWYRYDQGKFAPEYIDRNLCTHVVYAFASLDPNDLTLTSGNEWEDFENSNSYNNCAQKLKIPTRVILCFIAYRILRKIGV